jgi:biopolymer transport protein ExbB
MGWLLDVIRLLAKGGFAMIPLMFCSFWSVTVLFERWFRIKTAQIDVSEAVRRAEDALFDGKPDMAVRILEDCDGPVTRVLAAGIRNRHLGERGIERAMEEQGMVETRKLTRWLGSLDTIITIAPLLGLLGTVTGMISAFHVIGSTEGLSTPTAITGGVAEALIATATGLAIAIFTLVGYNHLQERIKNIVTEIEHRGTAMVNVLVEAGETSNEIKSLSA